MILRSGNIWFRVLGLIFKSENIWLRVQGSFEDLGIRMSFRVWFKMREGFRIEVSESYLKGHGT